MSEGTKDNNLEFEFQTVGEKLKAGREAKNLSLADLSARTKINRRHLEAIEQSDFDALVAPAYAVGFVRTYAKEVGLDSDAMVGEVREQLGLEERRQQAGVQFELDEPSKVPSARIAWIAAAVAAVLLIGSFGLWRTYFFPAAEIEDLSGGADIAGAEGEAGAGSPAAQTTGHSAAPRAAAIDPAGEVVFTAKIDDVWVKFYDGEGEQLMQKQMALGERYTVPAGVSNPQIWTGRPDAFDITIGGKPVPPLGTAEEIIKDVPISAEALLARTFDEGDGDTGETGAADAG